MPERFSTYPRQNRSQPHRQAHSSKVNLREHVNSPLQTPTSNTHLNSRNIQIPINLPILPIVLLQPDIRFLKMPAIELTTQVSTVHPTQPFPVGTKILTNPFAALNGLGCTLCKIQCLFLSTPATLFFAGIPHAKNTTPFVRTLATVSITFCVNPSHP